MALVLSLTNYDGYHSIFSSGTKSKFS